MAALVALTLVLLGALEGESLPPNNGLAADNWARLSICLFVFETTPLFCCMLITLCLPVAASSDAGEALRGLRAAETDNVYPTSIRGRSGTSGHGSLVTNRGTHQCKPVCSFCVAVMVFIWEYN